MYMLEKKAEGSRQESADDRPAREVARAADLTLILRQEASREAAAAIGDFHFIAEAAPASMAAELEEAHDREVNELASATDARLQAMELTRGITAMPEVVDGHPMEPSLPTAIRKLQKVIEAAQVGGQPIVLSPNEDPKIQEARPTAEDAEQQPKIFNAEEHYVNLRRKVAAIADAVLHRALDSLSQEQILAMRTELSQRTSGPPHQRAVASYILSRIREFTKKAKEIQTSLNPDISSLINEIYRTLSEELTMADFFGASDLDEEIIRKRNTDICQAGQSRGDFSPLRHLTQTLMQEHIQRQLFAKRTGPKSEPAPAEIREEVLPKPSEGANVESETMIINTDVEAAWIKLTDILLTLNKTTGVAGVRQWIMDVFNPLIEAAGDTPLTIDDLRGLHLYEVVSGSASDVVGYEVRRPVFIFSSLKEFHNFCRRIGYKDVQCLGMALGMSRSNNETLQYTGLLFSIEDPDTIDHEVRHSAEVDKKQNEELSGLNALISEAWAFYPECILKPAQTSHDQTKVWDNLKKRLADYGKYINQAKRNNFWQLSLTAFDDLVEKVVQSVRMIAENKGHIEAQKTLLRVKNLYELLAINNITPPVGL